MSILLRSELYVANQILNIKIGIYYLNILYFILMDSDTFVFIILIFKTKFTNIYMKIIFLCKVLI